MTISRQRILEMRETFAADGPYNNDEAIALCDMALSAPPLDDSLHLPGAVSVELRANSGTTSKPVPVHLGQLLTSLGHVNLRETTFQMPDGLPVLRFVIEPQPNNGALITISDIE